jgi:5-methylcytosine-specific restriction protein A
MIVKLCNYPGCSTLTKSYYCPIHQKKAEQNRKGLFQNTKRTTSKNYHSLYQTYKWKKTSREFLKENPFCVLCGAKSEITDHIIPHKGNEEIFYNKNNLQALCWKCHSKKTLQENNFFQTALTGMGCVLKI